MENVLYRQLLQCFVQVVFVVLLGLSLSFRLLRRLSFWCRTGLGWRRDGCGIHSGGISIGRFLLLLLGLERSVNCMLSYVLEVDSLSWLSRVYSCPRLHSRVHRRHRHVRPATGKLGSDSVLSSIHSCSSLTAAKPPILEAGVSCSSLSSSSTTSGLPDASACALNAMSSSCSRCCRLFNRGAIISRLQREYTRCVSDFQGPWMRASSKKLPRCHSQEFRNQSVDRDRSASKPLLAALKSVKT